MELLTATRNSLGFRWSLPPPANNVTSPPILSFRLRYQAVGSTVVQYSFPIDASNRHYVISQLHENTYYDVCLGIVTSNAAAPVLFDSAHCVRANTTTDSLSVVLGSTFGAFMTLGMLVFLIFIAKWQHRRRLRKQHAINQLTSAHAFTSYSSLKLQQQQQQQQHQHQQQQQHQKVVTEDTIASNENALATVADQNERDHEIERVTVLTESPTAPLVKDKSAMYDASDNCAKPANEENAMMLKQDEGAATSTEELTGETITRSKGGRSAGATDAALKGGKLTQRVSHTLRMLFSRKLFQMNNDNNTCQKGDGLI